MTKFSILKLVLLFCFLKSQLPNKDYNKDANSCYYSNLPQVLKAFGCFRSQSEKRSMIINYNSRVKLYKKIFSVLS